MATILQEILSGLNTMLSYPLKEGESTVSSGLLSAAREIPFALVHMSCEIPSCQLRVGPTTRKAIAILSDFGESTLMVGPNVHGESWV